MHDADGDEKLSSSWKAFWDDAVVDNVATDLW